MKKLAIALVALTCLLAGALLPALAEANPVFPAAVEGPEKPVSEAAPATEPEAPKATREPKAAEKPDETTPATEPEAPKATREPKAAEKPDKAEPATEPEAPKATREPKAAEKPDKAEPDIKPEAPEPPHRHEHPGAVHRHHGEKGPQARPEERTPRGPREDERTWHAAPHCRRCDPERSRPHCHGCPFAHKCPGRQDSRPAEPLPDVLPEREPRREAAEKEMTLLLDPGIII